MSRLAVPRGNPWFPTPLVHDLKSNSPRWSLLTSAEQDVATRTASERPVMTLVMARQTILECLLDLRLARTVAQWREWSARLERVKAVLFDGRGDDDLRRQFLDPLRARFILLGAERDEAERIAPELVESVLSLRETGGWRPPTAFRPWHDVPTADIRKPPDGEAARADAERQWVEDGRQLTPSGCDWKGRYLDDELRAFSDDPPADPFLAARGPILDGFDIACLPANQRVFPPGFNRPAVECATKHVKGLLSHSGAILARVSRPESLTPDSAYAAAQQLDQLSVQLRSAWVSPELRERFHRHRRENYTVAGVIKPSAHEAVEELARRVWFAFRNAIGRVASNDSRETDRMMHGPWHWHEVSKAVPVVREENPGLLSALDATGYQTVNADLDRESAELKEPAPDAGPSLGTLPTRPTPDTGTRLVLPDPLPDDANPFRVIDWILFTANIAACHLTVARRAHVGQLGRKMRTENRNGVLVLHWEDDVDRQAVESELTQLTLDPWWKANSDARKLCARHDIPFNVYDPLLEAAKNKLEETWSIIRGVASDKEVYPDHDIQRRLHELADSTTPAIRPNAAPSSSNAQTTADQLGEEGAPAGGTGGAAVEPPTAPAVRNSGANPLMTDDPHVRQEHPPSINSLGSGLNPPAPHITSSPIADPPSPELTDPFDQLSWVVDQVRWCLRRELELPEEERVRVRRGRRIVLFGVTHRLADIETRAYLLAGVAGVSVADATAAFAPLFSSARAFAQLDTCPRPLPGDRDEDGPDCEEAEGRIQRHLDAELAVCAGFDDVNTRFAQAKPTILNIRGRQGYTPPPTLQLRLAIFRFGSDTAAESEVTPITVRQGVFCPPTPPPPAAPAASGDATTPSIPTNPAAPPAAVTPERGEGGPPPPPPPPVEPDGPFDIEGFRFAGVEVRFGRAAKQYSLVLALWDRGRNRPTDPRPVEDVISEVWGEENTTKDATFRQLCADARKKFQAANCLLDVQTLNGKVQLNLL